MRPHAEIIVRLRRELEETQQTLGAKFYALRRELDELEKELSQAETKIISPPADALPHLAAAKIATPTSTPDLVEIPAQPFAAEIELAKEAPPLSPAEDAKLIEVTPAVKQIPQDLLKEAPPVPPRYQSETEINFGQKWPLIIGVIMVVLGLAYFLKYSFDQNWVGPIGRVLLAYLASGALLGTGEMFRRKSFAQFGLYLVGGGIAALYLSTFAGYQIFHLIPVLPAFGLMILITVLAGLLAIFYDVKWLAVLGLIGGFVTPLILSTGDHNQIGLMSYLLVLNAGIVGLAFFKRWNLLTYLGFGFTWLLFSAWFAGEYNISKFAPTLFFLQAFFLTYALAPFLYYFVRERRGDLTGFAISLPNAFIAFSYSYYLIRARYGLPYVGLVSVAYAALYLGLAQHIYRRNPEFVGAFVLLLAKAMLFLVITIPVLFSKQWITIFWATQAAVIVWAASRLKSDLLQRGGLALLVITLGKFLFYDYPVVFAWNLHELAFDAGYWVTAPTRYLTTLVLLGTVFYCARTWREEKWFIYGTLLLFFVLNTEVGGFFFHYTPWNQAPALSILWAIFALSLLGLWNSRWPQTWLNQGGVILLGFTVAKFLLRDYGQAFHFSLSPLEFSPDYCANLPTRWLTSLVLLGALYATGYLLKSKGWMITWLLLLFFILNSEVGGCFQQVAPRAKFASISVLWALFAIGLMIFGFTLRNVELRRCAFGLFGLTIAKVFFFDMANISTPFRIISFIVLGLLLIGASFLYHRYRDQLLPPDDPETRA